MTFALSSFMLYTMWVILVLIGVDMLVDIYRAFKANSFSLSILADFLSGLLHYVFPLFILVNLMPIDPIGWLVQVAYYIGALGVIFKYLFDIQRKL